MTAATRIIERIKNGDFAASDELLPVVYDELRSLASSRLGKESVKTLQTTELVHEAYLRLVGKDQLWDGLPHFFAAAAEAMRRILVDGARSRNRLKRGGGRTREELSDSRLGSTHSSDEILIVNDLFDRFAELHPKEAEVAKLCYFADFSLTESAKALGISVATAHRRWEFARMWLYGEVSGDNREESEEKDTV